MVTSNTKAGKKTGSRLKISRLDLLIAIMRKEVARLDYRAKCSSLDSIKSKRREAKEATASPWEY